MIVTIYGGSISALTAQLITVEVKVQKGLPRFSIVGLADSTVQESRERVISSILGLGLELPDQILVNLSPADLKKVGAALDLPIALAICVGCDLVKKELLEDTLIFGELSLTGNINAVKGAVAYAIVAKKFGLKQIICPQKNQQECALIKDLKILPANDLASVLEDIKNKNFVDTQTIYKFTNSQKKSSLLFQQIRGQKVAKRASIIALAGGHHLLMVGSPGCGKTMMARSLVELLPNLSNEETIELASIHSLAGNSIDSIIEGKAPFRSPHYNISQAGLVGGGSQIRAGEVTLAHKGILFLDELPEFSRLAIESLRIPLEEKKIQISRANSSIELPANFLLISAMNPCPCGLNGFSETCTCSKQQIEKYQSKISQAILDRIDLFVTMEKLNISQLIKPSQKYLKDINQDQNSLKESILKTRELAIKKFGCLTSQVESKDLYEESLLKLESKNLLLTYANKYTISARSINKIIKVALTISLMENKDHINPEHIAESLRYRNFLINSNHQKSNVLSTYNL